MVSASTRHGNRWKERRTSNASICRAWVQRSPSAWRTSKADKDVADKLAMKKLPTWEDTLPASVTKAVAEALVENLKKEWQ
eukprot:212587-Amphidinium_carterae.1